MFHCEVTKIKSFCSLTNKLYTGTLRRSDPDKELNMEKLIEIPLVGLSHNFNKQMRD